MNKKDLKKLLEDLPKAPGVYLMKGRTGKVVYVGKANNLRSRVRQYFAPATSDTRHFVKNLASKLSAIETVITNNEKEAILLEYNLIQRHMPRYNIRLTDDKRFLHLRLDQSALWPKLELVRRPKKDKAHHFGPYHSAAAARETLRIVNRHFKIRNCKDTTFKNRVRPCLQHQIRRCLGPCTLPVDRDRYLEQVEYVRLFLEGRRDTLLGKLKERMEAASEELRYEVAAVIRDQIQAVEEALSPQRVTEISDDDRDVIGLYREGDLVSVAVMEFLQGRLVGRRDFFFKEQEFPDSEMLSSFIAQRYSSGGKFPNEILVSRPLDDGSALSEVITERKGSKVRVHHPQRGKRVEQAMMADRNAKDAFTVALREMVGTEHRLEGIQRKLHLPGPPRRIECVDIAHLGGQNTVGAISRIQDASVSKRDGKIYRIRSATHGDDFGAMHEVLNRRFLRASNGEDGWEAPDLLVVDGGKGQLNIALKVLEELGMDSQPVVALAKERRGAKGDLVDRILLPGRMNPIPLRDTSALVLLAVARDEAHRLANSFQGKTRRKGALTSRLDGIRGVGPKTRKSLLKSLGSVKRISEATVEDLCSVEGVGPKLAKHILKSLNDARA